MALHLNLLHEEILEQRLRKRDPLKLGILAMTGVGVMMVLYYGWHAYQTLEIKSRLSSVEHEWSKQEPKVTAAQKRGDELSGIIKTTKVLDDFIDNRVFWGPVLQKIALCVAPNIQLTSLDGTVNEDGAMNLSIDGVAAGREARAVAEDFRQMLIEQLGKSYSEVKVEFRALEDLDTIINVGGTNMAMAHYVLGMTFSTKAAKAAPSAAPGRGAKH
jgi:hypothetical protein